MSPMVYAQLVLAGLAGVLVLAAAAWAAAAAARRPAGADAAFWYCFGGAASAAVPLLWAYSASPSAGGTVLALLLLAGIPAAGYVRHAGKPARPVPDRSWRPAAELHAALTARWLAYELDPALLPDAGAAITDPARPATAAMVRAMDRANRLRPDPRQGPAPQEVSAYIRAVTEFSRRLDAAEAAAGIRRTAAP